MEAGLKFSESYPIFIHFGVARVVDAAEVKNVAIFVFRSLHGCPGEEGGGVKVVSVVTSIGCIVGGNRIVVEDEERANELAT